MLFFIPIMTKLFILKNELNLIKYKIFVLIKKPVNVDRLLAYCGVLVTAEHVFNRACDAVTIFLLLLRRLLLLRLLLLRLLGRLMESSLAMRPVQSTRDA